MLSELAIRDLVLIDELTLAFGPGLTVLTGETGAGKSILLDALGLALGSRGDAGLVRQGAGQAVVTAAFALEPSHPGWALLEAEGIPALDETLVLRRIVAADGRSRVSINGETASVALLRRLGGTLVEVQGQGEAAGLADPGIQLGLLDGFGGLSGQREAVRAGWGRLRAALRGVEATREALARGRADRDWLEHALAELAKLAPEGDEERALATERQTLQAAERRVEAIASADTELSRNKGAMSALRSAARALERLPPPTELVEPALAALGRAMDALSEAEALIARLLRDNAPDPRRLEQVEERLFALRGAARKHGVPPTELPGLVARLAADLAAIEEGEARIQSAEAEAAIARDAYRQAARTLSAGRIEAARRLEAAVTAELAPLRLPRARLVVEVAERPEPEWGADGADRVAFLVATNPGAPAGPIGKVASGGELARFLLALRVVLARGGSATTLVFDEVDAGIGGATAAAVGERLARLATGQQVLVVTHSPQVAARGASHLRVLKREAEGSTRTSVEPLARRARREEIARMLAGERVTDAARAAAADLLGEVA